MIVVGEREDGRERYEKISNVDELAVRFQELGIEVLGRPPVGQGGWREILKWANFFYGPATSSVRVIVIGEDGNIVNGMFSEDGDDNVFQFSIDGAVSAPFRGVKSITFGCSLDEEFGQCLLLKGGTIARLEAPVNVYIHETAKMRVISE